MRVTKQGVCFSKKDKLNMLKSVVVKTESAMRLLTSVRGSDKTLDTPALAKANRQLYDVMCTASLVYQTLKVRREKAHG